MFVNGAKCLRFKKKERQTPRQIRYVSYCEWALKIMKFQQEDKHNSYLEEVLHYISALVTNGIMGQVSLKEFSEALQIKML